MGPLRLDDLVAPAAQIVAAGGAEMRSRFFLNRVEHLDVAPASLATPPVGRAPVAEPDVTALGAALLHP